MDARETQAALVAATAELAEAHETLDAYGVGRRSPCGSPYSLPDRVLEALAEARRRGERPLADVAAISAQLAALLKRHGRGS